MCLFANYVDAGMVAGNDGEERARAFCQEEEGKGQGQGQGERKGKEGKEKEIVNTVMIL